MTESKIKKLNHYSVDEVIDTYNIKRQRDCVHLQSWLATEGMKLSDFHAQILSELPKELIEWQYAWNEEELKMNFISPVLRVADINQSGKIGTFFERPLIGKVGDITISVICDCLVATPKLSGRPNVPYFFLQEAPSRPSPKGKEKKNHDPEGQMLAAMILAQELNNDKKPLYGCWIQGKNWNFTVLIDDLYCVSNQFDATNIENLYQIVFIVRKLKGLILNR